MRKLNTIWANATDSQWNNWRWQLKNRIATVAQLRQVVTLSDNEEQEIEQCLKIFPMAITPHYASIMSDSESDCPIRMQAVPDIQEISFRDCDMEDPLHESLDSPVPGITHRYPDRILFLVTDQCAVYCRHCTRRRIAQRGQQVLQYKHIEPAIEYINSRKAVRDVLVSGGDPLTLPDEKLEYILMRLRAIKHVEIIRIGSRIPVVLPQRITRSLCKMLKKYHPLWLNTHFNHPREIVPESIEACTRLADAGIPVGNQSVLLKGINDSPYIMKELVQGLVKNRIRPYYIYQCDLSAGTGHFRTAVGKGIEIYENLRGHTSGLAVPTFVIDAPGGGGKIPLFPNYVVSRSDRKIVLRNFEGNLYTYTEPEDLSVYKGKTCTAGNNKTPTGVAGLLHPKTRG